MTSLEIRTSRLCADYLFRVIQAQHKTSHFVVLYISNGCKTQLITFEALNLTLLLPTYYSPQRQVLIDFRLQFDSYEGCKFCLW
jgi:hypothetical protein